jgi:hypothetical protein
VDEKQFQGGNAEDHQAIRTRPLFRVLAWSHPRSWLPILRLATGRSSGCRGVRLLFTRWIDSPNKMRSVDAARKQVDTFGGQPAQHGKTGWVDCRDIA